MMASIQIAEWNIKSYVLIDKAHMEGTNRMRLWCKVWGPGFLDPIKSRDADYVCTLYDGRLYHGYGGMINDVLHKYGCPFHAGNAGEVIRDMEQQITRSDWALWRSITWERKYMSNVPLILDARLRICSNELVNPNEDVIVGCNMSMLEFDGHKMGIFCPMIDGKIYWSQRTDRPLKLFNALNIDEVTESLNAQATEWAEIHG